MPGDDLDQQVQSLARLRIVSDLEDCMIVPLNGHEWTLLDPWVCWGTLGCCTDASSIWFQADPGALGRMAEDLPKSSWRIRGHGSETHGPSELVLGKNVSYIYI